MDAGHMIPEDQPDIALEVFKSFIDKGGRLNPEPPNQAPPDAGTGSSRISSAFGVAIVVSVTVFACLVVL